MEAPRQVRATGQAEAAEQIPRVSVTRARVIASLVFVGGIVVFLYFGLPKLVGFGDTIKRLREGNAWWLGAAAILEGLSFGGYVALFRAVFVEEVSLITWRASYEITMAGLAATRLFAAAGAGGIALTAWALRRSGMERRLVASRMVAFMALLYGVYMCSLAIDGLGLYLGPLPRASSLCDHRDSCDLRRQRGRTLPGYLRATRRLRAIGCSPPDGARLDRPRGAAGRDRAERGRHRCAHRDPTGPHPQSGGCWALWPGGASTSQRCGPASTPLAHRRRRP